MSRPARRALAALGVLGGLAILRIATALPVDLNGAAGGQIRLSWRVRSVGVETCREPDREAEEGVPEHMRPPEACVRRVLPFRLRVRLDGTPVYEERIRPAGARADRPVYVYREIPVGPGRHHLEVTFRSVPAGERASGGRTRTPQDGSSGGPTRTPVAGREGDGDPGREALRPEPPAPDRHLRLAWDGTVELAAGEAVVLTYVPERERLELRRR